MATNVLGIHTLSIFRTDCSFQTNSSYFSSRLSLATLFLCLRYCFAFPRPTDHFKSTVSCAPVFCYSWPWQSYCLQESTQIPSTLYGYTLDHSPASLVLLSLLQLFSAGWLSTDVFTWSIFLHPVLYNSPFHKYVEKEFFENVKFFFVCCFILSFVVLWYWEKMLKNNI